jgi:peptide/nickel transport system permease protein
MSNDLTGVPISALEAEPTLGVEPRLEEGALDTKSGRLKWVRLRVLVRMPLQLAAVIVILLLVIVAIAVAPFFANVANVQDIQLRFLAPFSLQHGWLYVLGADGLGRSELAQLLFGTRTSFLIAGAVVLASAVVGSVIGIVCGYVGGWVDALLMRIADVIVALPTLLIALAVLFVLSPSLINLVVVLALSRLPVYMRTTRAQTLSLRERTFVEASKSLGSTSRRIIFRDIAPMVTPTVLTLAMLEVSAVILAAAGLSFLGVGLERPNVDWGTLVSDGRNYLTNAWWLTVFPGIAIAITSLSANIMANWLRAMGDPNQNGRLVANVMPTRKRVVK